MDWAWNQNEWRSIGCNTPWENQGAKLASQVINGRSMESVLEGFWKHGIEWQNQGDFRIEKVWRFNAVADGLTAELERIQG